MASIDGLLTEIHTEAITEESGSQCLDDSENQVRILSEENKYQRSQTPFQYNLELIQIADGSYVWVE